MNCRIFVEKKKGFRIESEDLLKSLNEKLRLNLTSLRIIQLYDLFHIEKELLEKAKYTVFGEVVTDDVFDQLDLNHLNYIAVESLPGQFDQRASSAMECLSLLDSSSKVVVRSGKLIIFEDSISEEERKAIKKFYINEIESREKDMSILEENEYVQVEDVHEISSFLSFNLNELEEMRQSMGLAMSLDDLAFIQSYFKQEQRNPMETEIRVLDTYWSDHCRHTTFETELKDIQIEEGSFKEQVLSTLQEYIQMKKEIHQEAKTITLMDMATISGKYLRQKGFLDDLEISEEINACSVYVDVMVDGKKEKWLMMFKNETHNHPTEIEPFGGASTCIGGAIRDPLSGRSYVYQAMRITGAGDIFAPYEATLPGKLPQAQISKMAASGYSSYGNQIGLATTYVHELYHPGYVAKRLEIGAVVGAVKASDLKRETPKKGDLIILFGGATGRDGIGGATGSSKEHTESSIEVCASEVQKGNAPEERKIQRLFRRPEVTKLIKKSNDFGAGGVSVAIGELADGLDIYLDRVPVKYTGLNATEIAISESQERMSVVIDPKDKDLFFQYCHEENLTAVVIAKVTDTNRLVMYYHENKVVDISRDFINTNGVRQKNNVWIQDPKQFNFRNRNSSNKSIQEEWVDVLKDPNVMMQKGLVEMFDATIGASTVLMPYGGKYQLTETQVSVETFPVLEGNTTTASILSYGFDPYISDASPYHGSVFAILSSVCKIVAAGASYEKIRFTFQEYFERLNQDEKKWGKPVSALLGSIYAQRKLNLPSVGGKDSMSGTFKDLHVPPTLVSFAITTIDTEDVISPEFKEVGSYVYYLPLTDDIHGLPNLDEAKQHFDFIHQHIVTKDIISCYAVGFGGVCEALSKMSFGNYIGVKVTESIPFFSKGYGTFVFESKKELTNPSLIYLGKTIPNQIILEKEQVTFDIHDLLVANMKDYDKVYPAYGTNAFSFPTMKVKEDQNEKIIFEYPYERVEDVKVYIPVFPGTNCSIDTKRAFIEAGASVVVDTFCNQTDKDIEESIHRMASFIDQAHILVFAGGFSSGDEPDGSGKFIANVIRNEEVYQSIEHLLKRKGLILGICNGFQALVKSGLLPYGDIHQLKENSPTLFKNDINRHISKIATTVVASTASPWLSSFHVGEIHHIPISHGEGKFVIEESFAKELFKNHQVAFQYATIDGTVESTSTINPNGSHYAIEGIISKDGLILGKMGHSERKGQNLYKNIPGNKEQDIFKNAVNYFKKGVNKK